jgi:hypothetical protein
VITLRPKKRCEEEGKMKRRDSSITKKRKHKKHKKEKKKKY